MKYIEGSLAKSFGKISREHKNCWFKKKVPFKVKWQKKMRKQQFVTSTSRSKKSDLVRI